MSLDPLASWALIIAVLTLLGYFCLAMKERSERIDAVIARAEAESQREHLVCADDLAELNAIEQAVLAEQNTPIQRPQAISERPYDYEKDGL